MSNDKKADVITLGNSQFNAKYLRSVTLKEALEHYKEDFCHKDRVRNAWKRANGKK